MVTKENAHKWLEYRNLGIEPTRYKSRTVVYSNHSIEQELNFQFETYEVKLTPYSHQGIPRDLSMRHDPAFVCEVIVGSSQHQGGGNFDIENILNEIFTWLEFDFDIGLSYEAWEEYEGSWLPSIGGACSLYIQTSYQAVPKREFEVFLKKYETAKSLNSKKAKKIVNIRKYLQEGLKLKDISENYSFMSFYKVVEIVADDLASTQYCETSSSVVKEMVSFKLLSRGSQRAKIYYLLSALNNEFEKNEMIYLADIRNELAHNDHLVSHDKLRMCQKLAYWAAENYVSILASNA
ncbi:hypothetical protein [Aeromonas enteropelogenes]|uniref:hypothetical protein n=1 Tax=Aeromonas enteropelogenes TaxID=29489 RepID=UPI003B9F44FD